MILIKQYYSLIYFTQALLGVVIALGFPLSSLRNSINFTMAI